MSVSLKLPNFTELNIKEKTTLAAAMATGATTATVVNTQGLAANDYLYLGISGSERGEIVRVTSKDSATQLTTSATTLPHSQNDTVLALNGNQLRIMRAADTNGLQPPDNLFTELNTVNIDADQQDTKFEDPTGTSSYWYKFVYYNQNDLTSTDIAACAAARGGNVGNYVSLYDIREEAGFANNSNLSDARIEKYRQQAQATVNNALSGKFTLPFTAPINPTIERITMLYAAGYLEGELKGASYNINSAGVNNKVAEANELITQIKSGQLDLIGSDGKSLGVSSGSDNGASNDSFGAAGYPNSATAAETRGAEDFMFKREDIHGYSTRNY